MLHSKKREYIKAAETKTSLGLFALIDTNTIQRRSLYIFWLNWYIYIPIWLSKWIDPFVSTSQRNLLWKPNKRGLEVVSKVKKRKNSTRTTLYSAGDWLKINITRPLFKDMAKVETFDPVVTDKTTITSIITKKRILDLLT